MRVRRRIVVITFLVFLGATVGLGGLALASLGAPEAVSTGPGSGNRIDGGPELNGGASPANQAPETTDADHSVIWAGAWVAVSGLGVSFVLLRVEVRREKAAIRAKRHREEYYRDLKKYNAQLKGPPQNNT